MTVSLIRSQLTTPVCTASSFPSGFRAHSTQYNIHCSGFCCMCVAVCGGPLRHFFAFVQLESKNCNAAQVVQQLVTGKLDEFLNEYRILYDRMNDIVLKAMELSGCDSLFRDDTEGQAALSLLARKVCYQQWASFQRRICYPMKQQLSCSRVIHATILLPC